MSGTVVFGQRGLPAASLAREVRPSLLAEKEAPAPLTLSDRVPILTFVLIAVLIVIFALERRFAVSGEANGKLSALSFMALGGISYELVVKSGEWWRVFLAPVLHGSDSHLIGNAVALAFIGFKLEPLIGRRWFAGVFALSALGGVAGSLLGNPPAIVSVGASGAISGLIAALFTVSLCSQAADHDSKMLKMSLRFGVPALLPLAFGAKGNVDYHAHLGGALVGLAIGLVMPRLWAGETTHPEGGRIVGWIATAALVGTLISSGFAAANYSRYNRDFGLMPARDVPTKAADWKLRSAQLSARYPDDPRTHFFNAVLSFERADWAGAERDLRWVLDRRETATVTMFPQLVPKSEALLTAALAADGRWLEASDTAQRVCSAPDGDADKALLMEHGLCPGTGSAARPPAKRPPRRP